MVQVTVHTETENIVEKGDEDTKTIRLGDFVIKQDLIMNVMTVRINKHLITIEE